MLHLGFTGTRHGMTREQLHNVRALVVSLQNANAPTRIAAHHGDCVGADAEFHAICRALGCWMVGHPPTDDKLRAFCEFDECYEPRPFTHRNSAIVAGSSYMIGTPFEMVNPGRGGTWSTIGKAISKVGRLAVVLPDGTMPKTWDDVLLETMIFKRRGGEVIEVKP